LTDYLSPGPYAQFNQMFGYEGRGATYLNLIGVKYAICHNCAKLARGDLQYSNFHLVKTINGYSIFENDHAYPRMYSGELVSQGSTDLNSIITEISKMPTQRVALVGSPTEIQTGEMKIKPCSIRSYSNTDKRTLALVSCMTSSTLVLNEFFDPNWTSTVDGKKVKAMVVNGNQIGLQLNPGTHQLKFVYQPKRLFLMYRLSTFCLIGIVSFLVFLMRKRILRFIGSF